MALEDLINLTIKASQGEDDFSKGLVSFSGYGFLCRELEYLDKFFDLSCSSGLCHIGFTRDLLHSYNKVKDFNDFMSYYSESVEDLIYVGAIKTLVPSLKIGGDDVLFEVGLIINTPNGKLFPAQ